MKKIFLSLLVAGIVSLSFAESTAEKYVNSAYLEQLKKDGTVCLIHEANDNSINLVPSCDYAENVKTTVLSKEEKGVPFFAEFLYLIPKSKLLEGSSKKDINVDDLSILFRSISKMQGMRYHYNPKNGKSELLYKNAYMIESENSDVKIADQNTGNANGQISYCYQDDHTYGDTKYILHYYQKDNVLFSTFLNTIPMQYLGVKAVMDKNLQLNIIAIDCGDDLLLYLSTDVNAKSVPLFNVRKQIQESMTDRMEAIYQWFMVQFK